MKVIDTPIADVKILEPRIFRDARGFLMETWNASTFAALGLEYSFVQDNHTLSEKNVLRGLHYQLRKPQGKLVRVVAGAIFDVAVDLRAHSPSFKQWVGTMLTADDARMLWIPPGFAHGFLSRVEGTEVIYKCTEFHDPDSNIALLWKDPALGIAWPLENGALPVLSPRDAAALPLDRVELFP